MRDTPENRHARHTSIRNYTRAFEPGFDVENPPELPRVDLTQSQKNWIKRAWEEFFGYVPNAVPSYSEKDGVTLQPAEEVHIHHINPVGSASRRDSEPYNYPKNFVPVEASSHVGKGLKKDDERFVIHQDTREALENYGAFKAGNLDENPFKTMGEDRRDDTLHGRDYHDSRLDGFFRTLADMVVSAFTRSHPEEPFPEPPPGEGVFTWNSDTKEWEKN